MVVIGIIGVMSAVVVISMDVNNYKRHLKLEAERMAVTFRMASEESIYLGKEMGIQMFEDGYRFVVWDDTDPDETSQDEAADKAEEEADEDEAYQVVEQIDPNAPAGGTSGYTGSWALVQSDKAFTAHRFERDFRIYLEAEDSEVELLTEDDWEVEEEEEEEVEESNVASLGQSVTEQETFYDPTKEKFPPTLFVLSSGEMTPFKLELYSEEDSEYIFTIKGDILGNIKLIKPGEDDDL